MTREGGPEDSGGEGAGDRRELHLRRESAKMHLQKMHFSKMHLQKMSPPPLPGHKHCSADCTQGDLKHANL